MTGFHFISIWRMTTLTMFQPDAIYIYTKEQEKKSTANIAEILCGVCLHSFRSHFSMMVWNIQVCFIQTSESLKDEQIKVVFSSALCVLMTLRVHERRADVCSEDSFFLQLEPRERERERERSVYVANKMEMSLSADNSFTKSEWHIHRNVGGKML